MRGDAARVLEHFRQVQQVPCHERGVAVGEVVLRSARARIEIGRPWSGLTDPSRIGLRRDRVPEVLQAVEDVHGAVLHAVLVSGDQAAGNPAVIGVLARFIEQMRAGVQPFDHFLHHGAVVAEPDRPGQHEDVGRQNLLVDGRPFVTRPTVLGHVRPHPGRDIVINRAEHRDLDTALTHQGGAAIDQTPGMAEFG